MAGISVFQAGAVTPVVQDWVDRVKRNNGDTAPSSSTVIAANHFHKTLIVYDLVTKIHSCNFFDSLNLSASWTPFLNGTTASIWYASPNWSASDISINGLQGSNTGASGNALGKYLGTGIIPSQFSSMTSSHLVVYFSGSAESDGNMGCSDSGTSQLRLYANYPVAANTTQSLFFSGTGTNTLGTLVPQTFSGYIMGTRGNIEPVTTMSIFAASSTVTHSRIGTSTITAGTTPTTRTMFVFTTNESGNASTKNRHLMSFVSCGQAMNFSQSFWYHEAILQLRKEMGGGYY